MRNVTDNIREFLPDTPYVRWAMVGRGFDWVNKMDGAGAGGTKLESRKVGQYGRFCVFASRLCGSTSAISEIVIY